MQIIVHNMNIILYEYESYWAEARIFFHYVQYNFIPKNRKYSWNEDMDGSIHEVLS